MSSKELPTVDEISSTTESEPSAGSCLEGTVDRLNEDCFLCGQNAHKVIEGVAFCSFCLDALCRVTCEEGRL